MKNFCSIPFEFTLESSHSEDEFINQLIQNSAPGGRIFEISQCQLGGIKDYVHKLLDHIKTLEERLSFKENQLCYLQTELQSRISTIKQLTVSKNDIQRSIKKITDYNKQYLDIIQEKNQEIENLKNTSMMLSSRSTTRNYYCTGNTSPTSQNNHDNMQKSLRVKKTFSRETMIDSKNKPKDGNKLLKQIKRYVTDTQLKYAKTGKAQAMIVESPIQ